MKSRPSLATSLLLCLACAQVTQPPMQPTPDGPFAALDRLADALREAGRIAREADPAEVPRGEAEGALHVVRQLLRAIDEELAWADTAHPYLDDIDTRFAKLALGNPDNLYLVTRVDDEGVYRITGRRGTTSDFAIQLYQGYPGIGRPFEAVGSLDLTSLDVGPGARFEVMVSADPQPGNWIRMLPSTRRILVRYTYGDWGTEEAGELRIERIDTRGVRSVAPTSATVVKRLDAASFYLQDALRGYLATTEAVLGDMPPNQLAPLRLTGAGGLADQYSTSGHYRLRGDQALVVTTQPSNARYQGFQLGTWWFASLDYANRQTSLTTRQAHLSSDGVYRFVVSTRDPGVPNWLDASSDPHGLMLLRWQGASELGPEHQPHVELVAFDALRSRFSADEPIVSPEARRAQIASRRDAIDRRFGLASR